MWQWLSFKVSASVNLPRIIVKIEFSGDKLKEVQTLTLVSYLA